MFAFVVSNAIMIMFEIKEELVEMHQITVVGFKARIAFKIKNGVWTNTYVCTYISVLI